MPIKDLSETVRLPRLGKIHLGIKDPEKGYPKKTEYFVFPKDHSDYESLVKLFGEKPKELRILIPVEDEEAWAAQYYKAYNQTFGLICKGDGETAMQLADATTKQMPTKETRTTTLQERECLGTKCPDYIAKKCHEVMNLRFIIPEVPGLGVWQIDTGSKNSIININSCARVIKRAFGRVSMIPLRLTFEPIQVNNPTDGKKQTVYVLNLRSSVTLAQLADAAREQFKTFLLPEASLEDVYDSELEKETEELFGNTPVEKPTNQPQEAPEPKQKPEKPVDKVEPPAPANSPPKTGVPQTLGDLLTWCYGHGKNFNRAWFFKTFSDYKPEALEKDKALVERAYLEAKQMMDW